MRILNSGPVRKLSRQKNLLHSYGSGSSVPGAHSGSGHSQFLSVILTPTPCLSPLCPELTLHPQRGRGLSIKSITYIDTLVPSLTAVDNETPAGSLGH